MSSTTKATTQNNKKQNNKNKAIASVTALALLATGTFAWQSFDQVALNETKLLTENAGVRLHDDFDGSNKDVYVENYTTYEEGGELVYGRIRLDEYLEIGKGSGSGVASESISVIRGDKLNDSYPNINDVTTWDTYLFGSEAVDGEESIRTYRDLEFGGSTVYMPTFNKNADSLEADINGTLEGPDGDIETEEDDYLDYVEYTLGDILEGNAVYDLDDNTIDEGENAVEGDNIETVLEEHVAAETLDATVISMATWNSYTDEEKEAGPFWIYDADGWAYWSEAMEPESATGLLLTGITETVDINDSWFYSINVVGMFATAGDWGDKEAGTGMYADITDDALKLLNTVSDIMKLSKIAVAKADGQAFTIADTEIAVGETLELVSDVVVQHGVGEDIETAVTWEVLDDQGTPVEGVAVLDPATGIVTLNPTAEMTGNTYTIKITSEFDPTKTSQVEITVYDPAAVSIDVYAVNDETTVKAGGSVQYQADVEGLNNKSVSWSVSGNSSDNTTINSSGKLTVGADESSNRALTVTGSAMVRPETTDTVGVQTETQRVTVSIVDNATQVKPGNTQAFTVLVEGMANEGVDWSVTKGTSGAAVASGTSISTSGMLTVSSSEATGSSLRIKATSKGNPSMSAYKDITVPESLEDLVGSTTTVNYDGIEWYVVDAKQINGQDAIMLFSKEPLASYQFHGTSSAERDSTWQGSDLQTYMNSTTFTSKFPTLYAQAIEVDTSVATSTGAASPSTDKVFAISEAEYTALNAKNAAYVKYTVTTYGSFYWLRSPYNATTARVVFTSGGLNYNLTHATYGVRPALWIYQ